MPEKINIEKIRKRWWIVAIVSLLFLIIDIFLFYGIQHYFPDAWEDEKKELLPNISANDEQMVLINKLKDIELNSPFALVVDLEDNRTLYEKNADQKIYPASLTKVLTGIVALDYVNDMQMSEQVTEADLANLLEENASVAGLKVGDTLSYEQALYALILPSGADAANFLANHLAKNNATFVEEMNKKANSLGMVNTHFMNTTGLHDDNHYTTLNEMKIMMTHAWKNPVFKEVMTTMKYPLEELASHPDGLDLTSSLIKYGGDLSFEGGEIIGGKSGFTFEAESCLISIAKMSNGHLYMVISAKASGDPVVDHNHILDAKKVYEQIYQVQANVKKN